jgi:hypothetical protein
MTVCIASICRDSGGDCIVGLTDKMLSMSTASADDLAIKFTSVGDRWVAMFAGNDISPVVPVFKTVRSSVSRHPQETLEEIVDLFTTAIRKERTKRAEAIVLSRFDLDMAEFRREGLANLGSELFTRLAYEIEQVSLDLTFLVYGFEGTENPQPHIFSINGNGEVSYFDIGGFWAIGSGQTSALGTLFGTRSSVTYKELPDALYLLAKAKFSAESALGVGKETTALILQSDSERYLVHAPEMQKIKAVWEAARGPDVPDAADTVTSELLAKAKAEFGKD